MCCAKGENNSRSLAAAGLLPGNLSARPASFRKADCDRLFSACHLFAGSAALQGSSLALVHCLFNFLLRLLAILSHSGSFLFFHCPSGLIESRTALWVGSARKKTAQYILCFLDTTGSPDVPHKDTASFGRPSPL